MKNLALLAIIFGFFWVANWYLDWSGNGILIRAEAKGTIGYCHYYNGTDVQKIRKRNVSRQKDWKPKCGLIQDLSGTRRSSR